ncbi:uncharacterized protein LOC132200801 isoform X2 [Neocloeon triangulifer]|uniref:uncharacterized protein LOC132200801 isoform X2 n=1 Tax=Neocloeon triangulifer TaxID=2078957 RepID=UPI00286F91DA|nr:uncharacterized protein LOC132200801 isoform X2 [Neocloeon triangulifer]
MNVKMCASNNNEAERQRNLENFMKKKEHRRKYSVTSYKTFSAKPQQLPDALRTMKDDARRPTRSVKNQRKEAPSKVKDTIKVPTKAKGQGRGEDEKQEKKEETSMKTKDPEVAVAIPKKRDDISVALDKALAKKPQGLSVSPPLDRAHQPPKSKPATKEESTKASAAEEMKVVLPHTNDEFDFSAALETVRRVVAKKEEQPSSNYPAPVKVQPPLAQELVLLQKPAELEETLKTHTKDESSKPKLILLQKAMSAAGPVIKNCLLVALLVGTGVVIGFIEQEHLDDIIKSISTIEIIEHF